MSCSRKRSDTTTTINIQRKNVVCDNGIVLECNADVADDDDEDDAAVDVGSGEKDGGCASPSNKMVVGDCVTYTFAEGRLSPI